MKLAIAVINQTFAAGSTARICVCDESTVLFHLRSLNIDCDEKLVNLYEVEEEMLFCNFEDGFISTNYTIDIPGIGICGCKLLCGLTQPNK